MQSNSYIWVLISKPTFPEHKVKLKLLSGNATKLKLFSGEINIVEQKGTS